MLEMLSKTTVAVILFILWATVLLVLKGTQDAVGLEEVEAGSDNSNNINVKNRAMVDLVRSLRASNIESTVSENVHAFVLRPRELFVSYHGVLVLVFGGWPAPGMSMKASIENSVLPRLVQDGIGGTIHHTERGGSKFPKTTLGVMCSTCTLTLQELTTLQSLCKNYTSLLHNTEFELPVNGLDLVAFQNRALTKSFTKIPLKFASRQPDSAVVSQTQKDIVDAVVAEGSDTTHYINRVNLMGNRAPHYTDVAMGATAVTFWTTALQHKSPTWHDRFMKAVDKALPGKYLWFPFDSLHVTHRGIVELD
eukprot:m.247692 g.247692  ORF g.247692 m.247692 type:complete len:308 (+) comp33857_c6_seq13:3802-4725(+)